VEKILRLAVEVICMVVEKALCYVAVVVVDQEDVGGGLL
jgi:hypothetical protein